MNALQIFKLAIIVSILLLTFLLSLSVAYTNMKATDLLPDMLLLLLPIVGYKLSGLYQKHKKPKYYILNGEARLAK